jgi:hypothetical protein
MVPIMSPKTAVTSSKAASRLANSVPWSGCAAVATGPDPEIIQRHGTNRPSSQSPDAWSRRRGRMLDRGLTLLTQIKPFARSRERPA